MIDNIKLVFTAKTKSITGPFPVALMSHYYDATTPFFCQLIKKDFCFWLQAAMIQHLCFADGKRLEGFKGEVAKIMIELFAKVVDLSFCFVGESVS